MPATAANIREFRGPNCPRDLGIPQALRELEIGSGRVDDGARRHANRFGGSAAAETDGDQSAKDFPSLIVEEARSAARAFCGNACDRSVILEGFVHGISSIGFICTLSYLAHFVKT